jgi:hypothetical protein
MWRRFEDFTDLYNLFKLVSGEESQGGNGSTAIVSAL